jgi:CRP-like cAMP-binding protein
MKEDAFTVTHAEFRTHLAKYCILSEAEFVEALEYFSFRRIAKDTILIHAGEPVHHTYWVVRGLLFSTFSDVKGKEHITQFATENCWITDQNAFYNQTTATLRVEALEDSTVLSLSFADREKLCEAIPAIGQFFRRKANDSFVKQQKRLLTYMTSDAQERFDQLMREYPGLHQRVPKHIIAAYLGVTRETLSRFKRK